MSQRRVGVWRAMLGASRISHEKRQLAPTCNNFHKMLKIKEIIDSGHIGVPICNDRLPIATAGQLCAEYRCGSR